MNAALNELLTLLDLEPTGQYLFRGQCQDLGLKSVFGGQVMGQALSAAQQTVDRERHLHSFHCYFLRPGRTNDAIMYAVEPTRDGHHFTSRRVTALQKDRPIFEMSLSFQSEEEGYDHQCAAMPDVPQPEALRSDFDRIAKLAPRLPAAMADRLLCERPMEFRTVNPINLLNPQPAEPLRHTWIKASGTLSDDLRIHKYLLAYASDFGLLTTSLNPHGVNFLSADMKIVSIDHAMWFHRPFRMDEWLLYSMESPTAAGARGVSRGQIFDRQGQLVASTMQEGLIRRKS